MAEDPKKNRYAKNRNLWRRTYSFRRRKPNIRQFVDATTNVSFSYDLNKIFRHRDYFIIKGFKAIEEVVGLAEYDEGLVAFNNTDTESTAFNFCFSDTPDAVVLTVDGTDDNSHNIIAYGLNFTSCSMSIGVSAPFSGNIRYRAAFSSTGYPASVTSSLVPASGTFTIFAGHITASNETEFTLSHSFDDGGPSRTRITPWDFFDNFDVNVAIVEKEIEVSQSSGSLSAPVNNPIYFIASK